MRGRSKNNQIVSISQMIIFNWRFRCRCCRCCLSSRLRRKENWKQPFSPLRIKHHSSGYAKYSPFFFFFFVKACSFSADGKLLASASDDQTVSLQSFFRSVLSFWRLEGQGLDPVKCCPYIVSAFYVWESFVLSYHTGSCVEHRNRKMHQGTWGTVTSFVIGCIEL